jgi:death-on-curing family protein
MCMNLTKKDIIAMNQKFFSGEFQKESDLNFALECTKHKISWTKQLAYLIRAILIGHVFVDGNKRTAYMLLLDYVDLNGCKIEEKQAVTMIKNWVLKHEENIENIQRRIEDAVTKK